MGLHIFSMNLIPLFCCSLNHLAMLRKGRQSSELKCQHLGKAKKVVDKCQFWMQGLGWLIFVNTANLETQSRLVFCLPFCNIPFLHRTL